MRISRSSPVLSRGSGATHPKTTAPHAFRRVALAGSFSAGSGVSVPDSWVISADRDGGFAGCASLFDVPQRVGEVVEIVGCTVGNAQGTGVEQGCQTGPLGR